MKLRSRLLTKMIEELRSLILSALLYAAVLAGGVWLCLVVSSAIGYLPYSDRPGPGWFTAHLPTLGELGFFGSWALFFVGPFALFWGAILFAFTRLSSWLGSPKWLLRILGGFFGAVLGLLGIEAAGWYIAISAVAVYAGALLGLTYGALLLPRFAITHAEKRLPLLRWFAIAGATVSLLMAIVYPMIPDRDAQSLEVLVIRLVPGPEELASENTGLNTTELVLLRSVGLRGRLHYGIQSFTGAGGKQARAIVVVTSPISAKVTLKEPKATSVIYIQEHENWDMYPTSAPTLRKTIVLKNAEGEYEGLTVAIDPVIGKPPSFTWYPPIKAIQSNTR